MSWVFEEHRRKLCVRKVSFGMKQLFEPTLRIAFHMANCIEENFSKRSFCKEKLRRTTDLMSIFRMIFRMARC